MKNVTPSPASIINDNFYHHSTYLQSLIPGMKTTIGQGFSYSDSGLSCDTFNILYITDASEFKPEAFQKALQTYDEKDLAYCIWINEENLTHEIRHTLTAAGIKEAATEPGMILDLADYVPENVKADIVKLNTPGLLEEFAKIVSLNWDPPDRNVIDFYHMASPLLLHGKHTIEYFGSYADGRLVSVMEVFPDSEKNAGIYSVCTLSDFRRKGIGTNLLKHCLAYLKNNGYSFATLQAADDGLNIYKKLGFTEATRFYEFKKL
ncbi:MAG TPA: GNAT family N-acetyltransferase [Chitinophagaceae bacterium]